MNVCVMATTGVVSPYVCSKWVCMNVCIYECIHLVRLNVCVCACTHVCMQNECKQIVHASYKQEFNYRLQKGYMYT